MESKPIKFSVAAGLFIWMAIICNGWWSIGCFFTTASPPSWLFVLAPTVILSIVFIVHTFIVAERDMGGYRCYISFPKYFTLMSWYASVISGIWGLIMFAPVLPAYIGGPLALLTFILLLTLVLQAAKKISLEW